MVGPVVILRKTAILIRGIREVEEWVGKAVEIGFTAKAVAFRLAASGIGWRIRKTPKASGPYYRLAMPAVVWAEIERRGFPVGQPLPARWDERSQMVVAVRPAEKAQGRKAG